MNLEERKELVRQHIKMKWQCTSSGTPDKIQKCLIGCQNNKDRVLRLYTSSGIIPAIVDDCMAVLDCLEDRNVIGNQQRTTYHVDNAGNEFRGDSPYFSIMERHLIIKRKRESEVVERQAAKFIQDVTYVMDAMLLGYNDEQIEQSMMVDKRYLNICLSVARKNKIKRHIQKEKYKQNAPYAIARSIETAGMYVKGGLETIADTINLGFDKVSRSILFGMTTVAQSNMKVAQSLDRMVFSQNSVAAALQDLYGPISVAAYASRRYTQLQEHIHKIAQHCNMTPIISGSLLLVNTHDGSSAEVCGQAYKRDGCYIIDSTQGPLILPDQAFMIFNAGSGIVDSFREQVRKLNG